MKPSDVSQEAWDAAAEFARDFEYEHRAIMATIARAIMAAKAGEREACAFLAEHRHNVWGTRDQTEGIEVEDDRSACFEIASAIRSRT